MDKYSRRIVGWSLADNRTTAITVAAFDYFFHSLKSEELAGRRFASEDELLGAIRSYIPRYTSRRLHSSLGMRSPIDYERLAA